MNTLMEVAIAILNSLWQAALLAGLVWLVLRFARGMNAATRFAIWWAVLGVVLILPSAPSVISAAREWLQPATIQATRPVYAAGPTPIPAIEASPLVTIQHRSATHWPMYVVAAWGLILLYRLSLLVHSYICVRRIKRRASVSSESLPPAGRSASLLLSREIHSPIAVGFARPAVILPDSLPAQLSREEMDHVLLHENRASGAMGRLDQSAAHVCWPRRSHCTQLLCGSCAALKWSGSAPATIGWSLARSQADRTRGVLRDCMRCVSRISKVRCWRREFLAMGHVSPKESKRCLTMGVNLPRECRWCVLG